MVLQQAAFWGFRSVPARIRPDPEGLLVMHYIVRGHEGIGGRVVRERALDEPRGNYALAVWAEEDDLHVRAGRRFSEGSPDDLEWVVVEPTECQAAALIGYGLCYALNSRRLAAARWIVNGFGLPMDENSALPYGFVAPTLAHRAIDEESWVEYYRALRYLERARSLHPECLAHEDRRNAPPAPPDGKACAADAASEASHG
jgi:hypothetical protein